MNIGKRQTVNITKNANKTAAFLQKPVVALTIFLFSDIFKKMLDFSCFCDAHLHLVQCGEYRCSVPDINPSEEYYACTCAHDVAEFLLQEQECRRLAGRTNLHPTLSFGLHPQNPLVENADFLERLLKEERIGAVGEAGFDLFTQEFKADIERQKEAWRIQLELAAAYRKPLVVHCRKGIDFVFADIKRLKAVPAVLFHSFFGGIREARALAAKGLHIYFSFGKQILNGNKKTLSCVRELPLNQLLLETDAPFQTLKGEAFTAPEEIMRIYRAAYALRPDGIPEAQFASALKTNFSNLYGIKTGAAHSSPDTA